MAKNPPANAEGITDVGSVPGLGRSPGGGHGNPFQYSCLENLMDRGAWWATIHSVTNSQTQLKDTRTCSDSYSFIRLFVQQILIENIQNSRPFSRFQEFTSEQNRQRFLTSWDLHYIVGGGD